VDRGGHRPRRAQRRQALAGHGPEPPVRLHQIRLRLDRLRSLRVRNDYQGLLFTLNEGIHGNMGGMGRSSLYRRAKFGTKRLIEQYIAEIDDALRFLADLDPRSSTCSRRWISSTAPISATAARR
jgi:hypothetical protein